MDEAQVRQLIDQLENGLSLATDAAALLHGLFAIPLPAMPDGVRLDEQASGGENTSRQPRASWNAVPNATRYVVELSKSLEVDEDGTFANPIESGETPDLEFVFGDVLPFLPTVLHLHVAAIGEAGRGAFSPILSLNAPMIYPPNASLFIDPLKGVFADAGWTIPADDGVTVGSLRGQPPANIDLTQPTGVNRFTYHAADPSLLNRAALETDGGDWMNQDNPSLRLMPTSAAWQALFLIVFPEVGTTERALITETRIGGGNDDNFGIYLNAGVSGRISVRDNTAVAQTGATNVNDGYPHLIEVGRTEDGKMTIRLDLVEQIKVAKTFRSFTTDRVTLGARRNNAGTAVAVLPSGTKLLKAAFYPGYDPLHIAEARMGQEFISLFHATPLVQRDPVDITFGWGAEARGGGLNATVIPVTNLNASGAGSFREAIETPGARKIVFNNLHGWIDQEWSPVNTTVYHHYLTIAGETAAGLGVGLRRTSLAVACHDLIIRNFRLVPGEGAPDPAAVDGLGIILYASNLFLQKMLLAGSTDELFQIYARPGEPHHITLADSIIAGALNNAGHPKGGHAMGALLDMGWYKISSFRNLYGAGEIKDRIPKQVGASGTYEIDRVNDIYVCYNTLPYFVAPFVMNLQGCTFVNLSSDQDHAYRLFGGTAAAAQASLFYENDNRMIRADGSIVPAVPLLDDYSSGVLSSIPRAGSRITMPYDGIMSASEAYDHVLASAGTRRSSMEEYLINRVQNRIAGYINSVADMGGYPTL